MYFAADRKKFPEELIKNLDLFLCYQKKINQHLQQHIKAQDLTEATTSHMVIYNRPTAKYLLLMIL